MRQQREASEVEAEAIMCAEAAVAALKRHDPTAARLHAKDVEWLSYQLMQRISARDELKVRK